MYLIVFILFKFFFFGFVLGIVGELRKVSYGFSKKKKLKWFVLFEEDFERGNGIWLLKSGIVCIGIGIGGDILGEKYERNFNGGNKYGVLWWDIGFVFFLFVGCFRVRKYGKLDWVRLDYGDYG